MSNNAVEIQSKAPNTLHIVLVDQNQQFHDRLTSLFDEIERLEDLSLQCHLVDTLDNAIDYLRNNYCDLIILNSDLTDLKLSKAIGEIHQAFYFCPILAIFRNMHAQDQISLVQAGIDDCLEFDILNSRILSRVIRYSTERAQNYRSLNFSNNLQSIINRLLSMSSHNLDIDEQMERCLQVISADPMIAAYEDAAIITLDDSKQNVKSYSTKNFTSETLLLAERYVLEHADDITIEKAELPDIEITPLIYNGHLLGVFIIQFGSNRFSLSDQRLFAREIGNCLSTIINSCMQEKRMMRIYQQNAQLIENISSALIGIDARDKITHWNSAAARYFSKPADEVLGQSIVESGLRWDWQKLVFNVHKSLESKSTIEHLEIQFTNASGKEALLSVSITPRISNQGHISGYLLLIEDITSQKEQQLQEQQNQRLQSIGQLAAGVAHEINTPIQYVSDNLNFIEDSCSDYAKLLKAAQELAIKYPEDKQSQRFLDLSEELELDYLLEELPSAISQTRDGVKQVSTIVRAMKDFSHPGEQGMSSIDINHAINSTLSITRNIWKYVAEITLDLDPNLPALVCYASQINEVLLNLIVNAADAIEEKYQDNADIHGLISIETRLDQDFFVISVADNGTGIDTAIQEQVFNQFFTTKGIGKGTGQGLSLSHRIIVEQHKGKLTFSSSNEGTCFFVHLPVVQQQVNEGLMDDC